MSEAAPQRYDGQSYLAWGARLQFKGGKGRLFEVAALLQHHLDCAWPFVPHRLETDGQHRFLADIHFLRQLHIGAQRACRQGADGIGGHREKQQRNVCGAKRPQGRLLDDGNQRRRYAADKQ